MIQRDTILQELKDCGSSLQPASITGPYLVPEGYFSGLPAVILSRIQTDDISDAAEELAALSPLLGSLPKVSPFKVPDGYFAETQEPDLSFLAGAGKKAPYTIPDNYFAQLPERIQRHTTTGRVVPLSARKWFRYAAAAVVTGVIVLSGIMIWRQEQPDATSSVLASKEVQKTLESTSVETLESFVQVTSPGITGKDASVATMAKNEELNSLFKDIPDSELNAFLDVTDDGSDDDSFLN